MGSLRKTACFFFTLTIGLPVTPVYGKTYNIYAPHNPFITNTRVQTKREILSILDRATERGLTAMTGMANVCALIWILMQGDESSKSNTDENVSQNDTNATSSTPKVKAALYAWGLSALYGALMSAAALSTEALSRLTKWSWRLMLGNDKPQPVQCDESGIHLTLARQANAEDDQYALYNAQEDPQNSEQLFIPGYTVTGMYYDQAKRTLVITTNENEA